MGGEEVVLFVRAARFKESCAGKSANTESSPSNV